MGMVADKLAAALRDPESARELDLTGTDGDRLTEIPAAIAKLENLEVLRLDRNGLTGLPEAIGKLKKLRELHAAHNEITSAGIHRSVWFIKTLAVLNLHGNRLAWVDNIGNYQKTQFALHLGGNPLDVSAYAMAGRPVHPLWTHVLHMVPLHATRSFALAAVGARTDGRRAWRPAGGLPEGAYRPSPRNRAWPRRIR